MGARPRHYLLTTALPQTLGDDWVGRFAAGLAEDQRFTASTCSAAIRSRHPGRRP